MTTLAIAVRGTVGALDARATSILFDRATSSDDVVRRRTSAIASAPVAR